MFKRFFRSFRAFFASKNSQGRQDSKMHILFIGNSYTHMNAMPRLFSDLAQSKGKSVHVEMCAHSGLNFKQQSELPIVRKTLLSRKWDLVILQGFSREFIQTEEQLTVNSFPYITAIVEWAKLNNSNCTFLFYQTWGYKFGYPHEGHNLDFDGMTERIEHGYSFASKKFHIPAVPVGRSWQNLRKFNSEIDLYDADLAHPNLNGSYLTANSFYTAIFEESPVGGTSKRYNLAYEDTIQEIAFQSINTFFLVSK